MKYKEMVILAAALNLNCQPSIKFDTSEPCLRWDILEGLVLEIITEEDIFCLLGSYVVQFGNYIKGLKETAVSFAVEECSFLRI